MKKTLRAGSMSEFLAHARDLTNRWFDPDDVWGPWFRGHQRAHWTLCPKLYREYGNFAQIKKAQIEDEIREEFVVRAPALSENTSSTRDEWEWYFLMQHFGTPTRLLDWTEGALIGLYFAVKDNLGFYDAAVWVLDPYTLNDKILGKGEVIPPSAVGITQTDRNRVKHWLPKRFTGMSSLPQKPIAIYPTHIARRISTQRSCFTLHGTEEDGLDKLADDGRVLAKIVIPAYSIQEIRRELEASGIDETTIFPDLDGLSRTICMRWKDKSRAIPHHRVFTRLRPSRIHKGGVGVFAIRAIKEGTPLFAGDNEEVVWVDERSLPTTPAAIRKLYDDFAVAKSGRRCCPPTFNRLTMAWYINEPPKGQRPNVEGNPDTYDFVAARNIRAGEELTVDYSRYSEAPSARLEKSKRRRRIA